MNSADSIGIRGSTFAIAIVCILSSVGSCGDDVQQPDQLEPEEPLIETERNRTSPGSSFIVGGSTDKDYYYPWTVRINGCAGVLITPQWVLTAAHCVEARVGTGSNRVSYTRHDLYTGREVTGTRLPEGAGQTFNPGVALHPDYETFPVVVNDIALVKMRSPFPLDRHIQTVAIPDSPRLVGLVGAYTSFSHDAPLPEGEVAVFRAPIPEDSSPRSFTIRAESADATGAPGDSGSGFITIEGGRAVVRGVTSQATPLPDGSEPAGATIFEDVFHHRAWIASVLAEDGVELDGNTRVRRRYANARGVVGIGCDAPTGTHWAPLDVTGVEIRVSCAPNVRHAVVCTIQGDLQGDSGAPVVLNVRTIRGILIHTRTGSNVETEFVDATSSDVATFFGSVPNGAKRMYECVIESPLFPNIESSQLMLRD